MVNVNFIVLCETLTFTTKTEVIPCIGEHIHISNDDSDFVVKDINHKYAFIISPDIATLTEITILLERL